MEPIQIQVRTYELDGYNHVNNAVYLHYLEYARIEWLRSIGFDYAVLVDEGYMLYVTRIDIRYTYSARLDDVLSVEVRPKKLGKVSGTFHQVIKNQDNKICAEADVTWCCVDKTGTPVKIPEKYRLPAMIPAAAEKQ